MSILRNPFVGWLLLLGVVVLAVRFVPYDWVATAEDKNVAGIAAATERMMPSDLGNALGQAAANAAGCGLEFVKANAEIALHTSNFEYRFIEPGGMLEGVYNDGYQSGRVNGSPPLGFCDGALRDFGPSGRVIPGLLRAR